MRPVFILFFTLLCLGGCPSTEPSPVASPTPEPENEAQWLGSKACGYCHEEAFSQWERSHHGLAERELDAKVDAGLSQGMLPDGHTAIRAIGVDPIIQYLVGTNPGRLQAHSTAWDTERQEWFDVLASPRQEGDWGHWGGRGLNWNSMCGSCHMTHFSEGYQAASDVYDTWWTEAGVGCEACHGPGSNHIADPSAPLPPPNMDTCASCHTRRIELTGTFEPGDAFLDHFLPRYPDLSSDWFADGQAQEEVFEWGSYLGSRMHQAGVPCTACHDAHSGQPQAEGDALCQRCHEALPTPDPGHGQHDGQVACVDCHMPERVYMNRHPRRDHSFSIPDPVLAQQIGSPDACSSCHSDRTAEWVRSAWVERYGQGHEDRRQLPTALAAARRGELESPGALLAHQSHPSPMWRATVTRSLEPWVHQPEVQSALRAAAQDEDPLVRLAAAQTMDPGTGIPSASHRTLFESLLRDPVRAVRVAAGAATRNLFAPHSTVLYDYRQTLELDMDQPTGQHALGTWNYASGRIDDARPFLARAVTWDPNSPAFRHSYAVALDALGDATSAREQLERAVELDALDPILWHALGLARAKTDPEGARLALTEAGRLAPNWSQPPRNLGLLLHAQGDSKGALSALHEAIRRDPSLPDLHYAIASVLRDLGRLGEAQEATRRVLELDPQHVQGQHLQKSLGTLATPSRP